MKFGNSKFYDIKTDEGLKSVNVDNIALVEKGDYGVKLTLNVKNENRNHRINYEKRTRRNIHLL